MATRPTVTIASHDGTPSGSTHPLPAVFKAPIRPDIVQTVHAGMAKNKRQPYAVSEKAGHQTSAESWGTGRAVARIPRVSGGGTHRAGQAAFGNMCRSGRMFAPTKVWRKWHQKINLGQKRFATTSALAASSVPSLLLARGHQISTVPEVPLVIASKAFEGAAIAKTSAALKLLTAVGAGPDVSKVRASCKLRAGKGKLRGRRHRQRRGPLIVYHPDEDGKELVRAFRNIPGVETSSVFALNLLQLAPGGHLGRFIVWTSSAFAALDEIYGSTTTPSALKKDFLLPSNVVHNADISRLINSSEVQAVVRPAKGEAKTKRVGVQKKNPLKNKQVLLRLNPYAKAFSEEKLGSKKLEDGKPERAAESFAKEQASESRILFEKFPAAVVTGSNSGIGHAFAEILVREGYQVHARDMTVRENMKSLGCQTHECDSSREASIQAFATGFKGRQAGLVLNIAGILHLGISKRIPVPGFIADAVRLPGIMAPHEQDTLEPTTHGVLLRTFSTNTFGPLLLTQALLPSLLLSPHPRIGLVSSRVGSIADDSSGGSYAYRASKAALNSVGKSMAIDLKEEGVVVVLMHPGYVKTGLDTSGKTHQMEEAVEPEEAAEKLWKVCMEKGIEETGSFWHRKGMGLDW